MTEAVSFLGMIFNPGNLNTVRKRIATLLDEDRYAYVVTPNVDHVVSYHTARDDALRTVYDDAALRICDSRILSAMAAVTGKTLTPCPGSDLTVDLLRNELTPGCRIAVIGPSLEDFTALRAKHRSIHLRHVSSPSFMAIGSPEWEACVRRAAETEWDILLICLSFPKQEFFAAAIREAGRRSGVAVCVGASVDFLTGRQPRAPKTIQKAGLEWLFRLASNPRRFWRRYLVRGPLIFYIALKQMAVQSDGGSR